MKTFTQQQVFDAYDRLPEPVKDAIFEEATAARIQEIGRKHGLLLDKIGNLAEDVGYVMLGLISAREFPSYIANDCGVPPNKADEIIKDLNASVFLPVQDHIFRAAETPRKEAPAPQTQAETPPPAFRQPSFAMPMQDASVNTKRQDQPSVAPMIFPQKMRSEEPKPAAPPPNQPHIIPKAPEFKETIAKPSLRPTPLANDPYREPIQ